MAHVTDAHGDLVRRGVGVASGLTGATSYRRGNAAANRVHAGSPPAKADGSLMLGANSNALPARGVRGVKGGKGWWRGRHSRSRMLHLLVFGAILAIAVVLLLMLRAIDSSMDIHVASFLPRPS